MIHAGLGSSLAVVLLVTVGSMSPAQQAIPSGKVRDGTLSFDGRATAGNFVGATTTVSGEMTGGPDLSAVRGWVEGPVRTLKTGNDHRDRDLNKSMESDKYPTMRFELTGVAPGPGVRDSIPLTLHGNLLIHGVERQVELPGSVALRNDEARLRIDFPLNVKDYKVGGLSKFFGMFKMNPDITVHVDVTFLLQRT